MAKSRMWILLFCLCAGLNYGCLFLCVKLRERGEHVSFLFPAMVMFNFGVVLHVLRINLLGERQILYNGIVFIISASTHTYFFMLCYGITMKTTIFRTTILLPGLWFLNFTLFLFPFLSIAFVLVSIVQKNSRISCKCDSVVVFLGVVALYGLMQTIFPVLAIVDVDWSNGYRSSSLKWLSNPVTSTLDQTSIYTNNSTENGSHKSIQIAVLSDIHLGLITTSETLFQACNVIRGINPDIVAITGDLLSPAISKDEIEYHLGYGLSPLQSLTGRVFFVGGNHDLSKYDREIRSSLVLNGILPLSNEEIELKELGIHIIGLSHRYNKREYSRFWSPNSSHRFRIVLLHDPELFKQWPSHLQDIVIAGHTHGGHYGLTSFGINFTFYGLMRSLIRRDWMTLFQSIKDILRSLFYLGQYHASSSPVLDYGLFSNGCNRLYVTSGLGSTPLGLFRIGTQAEIALLRIFWSSCS